MTLTSEDRHRFKLDPHTDIAFLDTAGQEEYLARRRSGHRCNSERPDALLCCLPLAQDPGHSRVWTSFSEGMKQVRVVRVRARARCVCVRVKNRQVEEWVRELREDNMLHPHFTVFFMPTKADLCPNVRTFSSLSVDASITDRVLRL